MWTYVLIHGAWHGGWCWRKVVPLLEAKGHRALAPDLPGHGNDGTPAASVTLKSYADRICEIARAEPEQVILVGHSMGGIAITQAAENCPKKIGALVYLCAFLPRNCNRLMTWASQDRESMVNPSTTDAQADGTIGSNWNIAVRRFTGIARTRTLSACTGPRRALLATRAYRRPRRLARSFRPPCRGKGTFVYHRVYRASGLLPVGSSLGAKIRRPVRRAV
jgi:pimeloyl-ACP methyl ester carboxylesterase